jgi:hypothetical protein
MMLTIAQGDLQFLAHSVVVTEEVNVILPLIIPEQAKKACWEMEVLVCYRSFTSTLHADKLSASCSGHFTLGERVPFKGKGKSHPKTGYKGPEVE